MSRKTKHNIGDIVFYSGHVCIVSEYTDNWLCCIDFTSREVILAWDKEGSPRLHKVRTKLIQEGAK